MGGDNPWLSYCDRYYLHSFLVENAFRQMTDNTEVNLDSRSWIKFYVCALSGSWVLCYVGMLSCWYVVVLVGWYAGMLVCWYVGIL